MNTQNLQQKNGALLTMKSKFKKTKFVSRSNKVFNKISRIKSLRLFWCIYFSLGDVVKRRNAANTADIALGAITQVAFKNCLQFENFTTEINETFVDEANFINIAMLMYNLIEYSDNYSDTYGSLWGFKRDDINNNAFVTNNDNITSFKYKASAIGDNWTKKGVKIAVPLKYLSNFWRSLEMPLINCKVELSLKWIENCVLTTASNASNATLQITDAKLYVPIVTFFAGDSVKLDLFIGTNTR